MPVRPVPQNRINTLVIDALRASNDGFGVFDKHDHLVFCNQVLAGLFGYTPEEACGKSFEQMLRHSFAIGKGVKIDSGDIDAFVEQAKHSHTQKGYKSFETEFINGTSMLISHMRTDEEELFVYTSDITRLKSTEQSLRDALRQLKKLAATDPLTGLYNRRAFFALAEKEFERSKRYGHPLSAIALDIDHFKSVNDTYGHQAGDDVLTNVADCCVKLLRRSDVFGRLGGEEFSVVLPEADQDAATASAERIRDAISDLTIKTQQFQIRLTVSLGVCKLQPGIKTLTELLDQADKALYQAKHNGRNRVEIAGKPGPLASSGTR